MEINNVGFELFDDYRLSAQPLSNYQDSPPGSVNFAELLKNAAVKDPDSSETGAQDLRTAKIDKNDKLFEQCLELETFLVKTLISSMRKTVQKTGLVDEGFAGKMYEDMLFDEYAKDFTKNARFGLAEQAYLELTGQRGINPPKPRP
jgi:flagellar protein FlgJ